MSLPEVGVVVVLDGDVARIGGLEGCALGEVIRVGRWGLGLVIGIGREVTAALLVRDPHVVPGAGVESTARLAVVPVGDAIFGRVLDPLGRPLDGGTPVAGRSRRWFGRALGVREQGHGHGLATGIKAVDVHTPLRTGTSTVIVGPSGSGKSALLATCVLAQRDRGVRCVVAAVGVDTRSLAVLLEAFQRARCDAAVIAAPAGTPPALQALAPLAAMSVAEEVREQGGDALVVIDELARHGVAVGEYLAAATRGGTPTRAEIYSQQAAVFARAGARIRERGGGSVTVLATYQPPQALRGSPLDPTFAVDDVWTLDPAGFAAGHRPALVTPPIVSKLAPLGCARALIPFVSAIRVRMAGPATVACARMRRLLEQPAMTPVPIERTVALAVAASTGVIDELELEDVPRFEQAFACHLDARPELLAALEPTRRLEPVIADAIGELARLALAEVRNARL